MINMSTLTEGGIPNEEEPLITVTEDEEGESE